MKNKIEVQVRHGTGADWETAEEFTIGPRNLLRAMDKLQREIDFPGRSSVGGYGFRVLVGGEVLPFYDYPESIYDAIKTLDGLNLTARKVGRPTDVDGKKVNTYLDAESIAIAQRLGVGNVSEGIRKALKMADDLSTTASLYA